MTKNGLSGILPVGTVLLLATLAGGCDFGPGHMMGQARLPASFASNGERIYFTGTSASGDPITFQGGDLHTTMMGASCANCHGPDRQGGRMMPRFWETAPPLTRDALFDGHTASHDSDGDDHGDHDVYSDDTLRRAVFEGVDPAGKPLDAAMPHWSMSERDWHDLLAYLHG